MFPALLALEHEFEVDEVPSSFWQGLRINNHRLMWEDWRWKRSKGFSNLNLIFETFDLNTESFSSSLYEDARYVRFASGFRNLIHSWSFVHPGNSWIWFEYVLANFSRIIFNYLLINPKQNEIRSSLSGTDRFTISSFFTFFRWVFERSKKCAVYVEKSIFEIVVWVNINISNKNTCVMKHKTFQSIRNYENIERGSYWLRCYFPREILQGGGG